MQLCRIGLYGRTRYNPIQRMHNIGELFQHDKTQTNAVDWGGGRTNKIKILFIVVNLSTIGSTFHGHYRELINDATPK